MQTHGAQRGEINALKGARALHSSMQLNRHFVEAPAMLVAKRMPNPIAHLHFPPTCLPHLMNAPMGG